MNPSQKRTGMLDRKPSRSQMRQDVLRGLSEPQKSIPCKYLYDQRGSQLFDRICELEEYYPTRTELSIMQQRVGEIVDLLGSDCMLIEYGSGSSIKTRLLLDAIKRPAAYVPVDISGEHLQHTAGQLLALYPDLDVMPVCADFSRPFELPDARRTVARRVVYFPGSTIGNFGPDAAGRLLRRMAEQCGPGGGLVIGADLKKGPAVLERAYDDDRGVTASFNRNLLVRLNRELDTDFRPERFRHHAVYNADRGRVEMHLISLEDQVVTLDDAEFSFSLGETIHTESSHKYDLEGFRELARTAGFRVHTVWTDPNEMFSVQYLVTDAAGT